ncbi:MAG TPA: hypothetical protein VM029_11485 [Opitutaceae bacterium]|nr:hypothetical protein [Opitutaceae bacterium]
MKDASPAGAAEVSSFLATGEKITGFAYDPFTDHFFLRLAPGNLIRVVDRPARAVKREFVVAGLPANGGGDLAVKPRTGHIFFLHADEARVSESTRLGKWERSFKLEGLTSPPQGIAYDATRDELLVLDGTSNAEARITRYDFEGRRGSTIALAQAVQPSLAFDSDTREIYAPLAGAGGEVGVFDEQGRLLRKLHGGRWIDVGPRSFVRVF